MTHYTSRCGIGDFHPETKEYYQGRRVIVTGGAGFIGSHVVEQLLHLGARPIVVSRRRRPGVLRDLLDRVEVRQCNLELLSSARKAIAGGSVVLHLAARVAGLEYNLNHPASMFHENIQLFHNDIKAEEEHGVERFLVTSSACVYPRDCRIPTPEEDGTVDEPESTNSGYGWAKRMEEYLGIRYAQECGIAVAIARPYNAYGPRDNFDSATSHVVPSLIRKAFESSDGLLPVWGDGSHTRSFLYVDDFARGLLEVAARYPKADPVNLGASEEITIAELAGLIANRVSEVRGIRIQPRFDASGLTGQPRRVCDVTKARRVLDYRAKTTMAEGIDRTVEWFAANENYSVSSHT